MTDGPAARATLYVGRALTDLGGVDPTHRAVLVEGDTITWTGADPAAAPGTPQVVDLGEVWLTPGFVDAHVHSTATGLLASGLDLTACGSAAAVIAAVRTHAAAHDQPVIHGSGWDDLGWPEGRPPTADELAEAAPGRMVVLTRIDGHSCLVDRTTLQRLDLTGVEGDVVRDRSGPTGWLLEEAGARAQRAMTDALSPRAVDGARAAACQRAIDLGITSVHEMGIPGLGSLEDAMAWATGGWPITVHTYWAAIDPVPQTLPDGPLRPGGDLFLDGSIGSCTAATHVPYTTNEGGLASGELFHDDEVVVDLFVRATRAGVGAGVHAIGDRATSQAVRCLREAAERCGPAAVRAARHRIEHAEMISRDDVATMARLGVTASLQPAFDATWNGPSGLYEHRFGRPTADGTNPFSWFGAEGTPMCFSSDSPVTPMDPWGAVLAAAAHHGGLGIDRRTALHAATIGGHRAVGTDQRSGALRPGHTADLVAWPADPLHDDPVGWTPAAVVTHGQHRR